MSNQSSFTEVLPEKTHFRFHIWLDATYHVEGFAEIPGRISYGSSEPTMWYSHLSFSPKNRITSKKINPETGIEEDVLLAYETTNSIYDVVSANVEESIIKKFQGQRYFAPLRNEVRSVDKTTGLELIQAEDPYLDGEPIWGHISQETDDWVEIQRVGSAKRAGDFRFLKY